MLFIKLTLGSMASARGQDKFLGYITKHLSTHMARSQPRSKMGVFTKALRGHAFYLRLLISWWAPIMLIVMVHKSPVDLDMPTLALILSQGVCSMLIISRSSKMGGLSCCWEDFFLTYYLTISRLCLWVGCLIWKRSIPAILASCLGLAIFFW